MHDPLSSRSRNPQDDSPALPAFNERRITMVLLNLEVGGLERVVVDMTLALAEMGHRLSVVTLRGAGPLATPLQRAGVDVRSLNASDGIRMATSRQLAAAFDELRPDLVHSHGEAALFYTGLCRLLPAMLPFGGPQFAHVHSRHGYEDVSCKGRLRNRLAHLGCDAVVCVSRDLEEYCHAVERLAKAKLQTIINGVDLRAYRALATPSWIANAPVIGHVARLAPVKNQALLLEAFALVLKRMPEATLSIIGDGPERPALVERCRALSIDERVVFHGETSDVAGKLADSHLFCLSSDSEGTPVSVIEALAAGRPVVATNVGGLAALVPNSAGTVVPAGDAQALANALCAIYADRANYLKYCNGARTAPAGSLDARAMLELYLDVYQRASSG